MAWRILVNILKIIIFWMVIDPASRFLVATWNFILLLFCKKPLDLRNKFGEWAVITGSTDGVGKAYAKELAKLNINIVLISRNIQKLEVTKKEIHTVNPNTKVKLITTDFSGGKNVFDKIKHELSDIPVGILVNNVGKLTDYPMYFDEIPEKDIWDMININIGATTMMTRIVIDGMKEREKGAIVNLSSGSDCNPVPLMSVYAASKAFVKSFSDTLRLEYSKHNITVQCLSPYFISTNMTSFSPRLEVSNSLVPDATKYVKSTINTLGRINSTTGYLYHQISHFVLFAIPFWLRYPIINLTNEQLRNDYMTRNNR